MLAAEGGQVSRAVLLGEEDGDARAGADDDEEEEVHHRGGNTGGGVLQRSRVAVHHQGGDGIVHLLEDVAQHQGEGQAQKMKGKAPLGQVTVFHREVSLSVGLTRLYNGATLCVK